MLMFAQNSQSPPVCQARLGVFFRKGTEQIWGDLPRNSHWRKQLGLRHLLCKTTSIELKDVYCVLQGDSKETKTSKQTTDKIHRKRTIPKLSQCDSLASRVPPKAREDELKFFPWIHSPCRDPPVSILKQCMESPDPPSALAPCPLQAYTPIGKLLLLKEVYPVSFVFCLLLKIEY